MLSYKDSCRVETGARPRLMRWLGHHSLNGQFVMTEKGRLSAEFQTVYGDAFMNRKSDGAVLAVEFKVEAENRWGNAFLEIWSNLPARKKGWLHTLRADYLAYAFVASSELWVIDLPRLQKWAFDNDKRNLRRFEPKPQRKYSQLNVTVGSCVPLTVLSQEVGAKQYLLPEAC